MTEDSHSSQYFLMNKDVCILHFSCTHNEFGEALFAEEEWLVQYRPIGYHGLQDFLERRRAPKHRAHIRELLAQCGCGGMEGLLRVTHALSLNDTFWVKGTESPLNWKEVSLYRNEFNEVISRAAFDGTFVSERMPSTSPEFGTDGGYAIGRIKNPNERLFQNRSHPPLTFCLPAEKQEDRPLCDVQTTAQSLDENRK